MPKKTKYTFEVTVDVHSYDGPLPKGMHVKLNRAVGDALTTAVENEAFAFDIYPDREFCIGKVAVKKVDV